MKKLIFICGPNGVGKSTACEMLNQKLINSARLDSDWCRCINPFDFTPENMNIIEKNITGILRNYLECKTIQYVIFSYGFHGPRKQIFNNIMNNLKSVEFQFVPIILTCSENENIKRMHKDKRDIERIKCSLEWTREIYNDLNYQKIDTTDISIEQTVDEILKLINTTEDYNVEIYYGASRQAESKQLQHRKL